MDARKKEIYSQILHLKREIDTLERELTRMERNLPEPWRRDRNYIPPYLRRGHG